MRSQVKQEIETLNNTIKSLTEKRGELYKKLYMDVPLKEMSEQLNNENVDMFISNLRKCNIDEQTSVLLHLIDNVHKNYESSLGDRNVYKSLKSFPDVLKIIKEGNSKPSPAGGSPCML